MAHKGLTWGHFAVESLVFGLFGLYADRSPVTGTWIIERMDVIHSAGGAECVCLRLPVE